MRKLFLPITLGAISLIAMTCKRPEKAKIFSPVAKENPDKVIKMSFIDDELGEEDMEVAINTTKNTATIQLGEKTFQLKKSKDLPNYTAENIEYRYSNIKGEITLLRKDLDMVLFHHKINK